jgi:hypothetical protein
MFSPLLISLNYQSYIAYVIFFLKYNIYDQTKFIKMKQETKIYKWTEKNWTIMPHYFHY